MFGEAESRRLGRLLARGLAVLTVVATLALAGPGTQRADAAVQCAGRHLKTVKFTTGELRIYKSRQYACAVTVARKPGARRAMLVSLQARGGRPAMDSGRFTRQAGPVTVPARDRCVRATGSVSGVKRSTGWVLC
ncbi:hypothetical protein OG883_25845 [Streptomyces sp. NBC_01142]|uniref:hypothetical protein n=1 Tax=Streptomyces sp. NBC_01142 TaxID=2975865 RepID=UPI00224DA6FC|nr:hypothetical protein [Streptomyces sp. NBC_01142]MCX4823247.1 hypothetical protein [Streptomyces sp. NBC_01142]